MTSSPVASRHEARDCKSEKVDELGEVLTKQLCSQAQLKFCQQEQLCTNYEHHK